MSSTLDPRLAHLIQEGRRQARELERHLAKEAAAGQISPGDHVVLRAAIAFLGREIAETITGDPDFPV